MDKKGQGLSINAIIVAAIALIVLVVLVAVFTGRFGGFISEVDRCKGSCVDSDLDCGGTYDTIDAKGACDQDGDGKLETNGRDGVCCISVAPN